MRLTTRLIPFWLAAALALPGPAATAATRDLTGAEYAAVVDCLLAARPAAARALLDSLATECGGEPFYLIAQGRLALENVPIDNVDKESTRTATEPVLAALAQAIAVCDARLENGGDEERLRLHRGWAWMVRSQAHALGRNFWSAGRDAGRGKNDLEFYLERNPDDPLASGLLGAFLYFTDAVPQLLQFLSKLVFMPTGDRDLGLEMINRSLAAPSPKREDFRLLAMNVNVFFEGRWEEGLPQAEQLHADYPAYLRLVMAPAVMRLWAPGRADHYAGLAAAADSTAAGLPPAAVDSATLWTVRTYLAWTERFLGGPAAAAPRFRAIVAADPAEPDWVTEFARDQLEAMAAAAADPREALPDAWLAAIPAASRDSLAVLAARLEARAGASVRAAFHAAECRLRLGQLEAAESLYRQVVSRRQAPGMSTYRMIAASRVADLAALGGRYRSASRWLDRALDNVTDEYRADWLLQGRRRYYAELAAAGRTMPRAPVLLEGLPRAGNAAQSGLGSPGG